MKRNFYFLLFGLMVLSSITTSCKKTMDLPALEQNKMLEYKVTNLPDTPIFGAINDIDRTVTVYLPFYYGLTVIDPEITVSDGATIAETIEPVAVSDTSKTYTVKGKDGTIAVYKLIIVSQVPTSEFKASWSGSTATPTAYPNNNFPTIVGNFYTTNASLATIVLINEKSGNKISINTTDQGGITAQTPPNYNYFINGLQVPYDIDSGSYKVRVSIWNQTSELDKLLRVAYQQPQMTMLSREVVQGETVTYGARVGSILLGLKSFTVNVGGTYMPLEIVSYTRLEAVFRVPADFPVGTYNLFQVEFEGYPPTTLFNRLVVNSK